MIVIIHYRVQHSSVIQGPGVHYLDACSDVNIPETVPSNYLQENVAQHSR